MYRPPAFALDDTDATAFVAAHPLAHLVVVADGLPIATPVPLLLRGDSLVGHLARANPVLHHPGPALAVFAGADAYVSPSWYPGKHVDGKVVPTWNYTTVQVRGTLVVHDDVDWTVELVRDLSDHMEATMPQPWSVDDAPADWVAGLARGIVGIELTSIELIGKHKMSQNRSIDDRTAIAEGLDARGEPEGSPTHTVADAVRATIV